MQYFITFLEGVISFISPCMLPMLPIYISYFSAGGENKKNILPRAIFFVLGFTVVFVLLGLFAGSIGALLVKYRVAVNIVSGLIVILLGLSFLEVIHIPFFKGVSGTVKISGIFSAFLFGMVFSVSLTPCVGAYLGSALMLASGAGTATEGAILLLIYSLGLGIPFVISAVLIDKLSSLFNAIKKNYRIINIICGGFLIIVGVLMMLGLMNALLGILS